MRAISLIGGFASVLAGALAPVAAGEAISCDTNCQSFCVRQPSEDCLALCQAQKLVICKQAVQRSQPPQFEWHIPWQGPQLHPSIIPYFQNGQPLQEQEYTGYAPPLWGRLTPNVSHDLQHGPGSSNDLFGSGEWVSRTLDDAKQKSDELKLHITDTAYAPLFDLGAETVGYGLYTYLLLRQRTDRERSFLKNLQDLPAAEGLKTLPPSELDILLLPAKSCKGYVHGTHDDCARNIIKDMVVSLDAYYNYDAAETLLDEICGNGGRPPEKMSFFCRDRYGKGPFLFTYAKPVSKRRQIPPPFLFFDFSPIQEAAFKDYIEAYEFIVKSDDYTDDGKLNSLRLRILNVIDEARSAAGPTIEAATILTHLIYQPEDKKEDKKEDKRKNNGRFGSGANHGENI